MKGSVIFDLEGTLVDRGGDTMSRLFITEDQLNKLASQYKVAIVTGASREQLVHVLNNSFLGKYFNDENTVTRSECGSKKASGKPFQSMIDRGLPQPVVVVGDSEGDSLGAAQVGASFVGVDAASLLIDSSVMEEYLKKIAHLQR